MWDLLAEAVHASEGVAAHLEERPLEHLQWTPPQLEWAASRVRRKLLRAGNQIGKTTIGLAEVAWVALGVHPYRPVRPPPVEVWIVCTTWPQAVAIMRKFWALVPKNMVRPGTKCEPRYGFGKDNPAVVFSNGSVVRFKTTNQGPEALAGATVHYVLIDEPTSEEVYRELDRRLLRTGGVMGVVLTPVNRPVEYLRQLVAEGVVEDHHAPLTVANLTPVGSTRPLRLADGTPMDARWIAEQRRLTLPRWAPIVLDGEWDPRTVGAVYPAYDPRVHVTEWLPDADLDVVVGLDWGEGRHRQVALVAGVDTSGAHPRVHYLAEHVSDGRSLIEDDARALIGQLRLAGGWTWSQVRHARGDRPAHGMAARRGNEEMSAALEDALRERGQLGEHDGLSPPILAVKEGRGGGPSAVLATEEWLHRAMVRPGHLTVHPRCERLNLAFQRYTGREDEYKDAADAARYTVWDYAIRQRRERVVPELRVS